MDPVCGASDTLVHVTGEGWSLIGPAAWYVGRFTGGSNQPTPQGIDQPDFSVTVDSFLLSGPTLLNVSNATNLPFFNVTCRASAFKIVDQFADPWSGVVASPGLRGIELGILIQFDPREACDIRSCNEITFIQAQRTTGRLTGSSDYRNLSFAEQDWVEAEKYDANVSPSGWGIDTPFQSESPYYPKGPNSQDGSQGPSPVPAIIGDSPERGDFGYPPDTDQITIDFETHAFCAGGASVGQFLGKLEWHWSRDLGAPTGHGTTTVISTSLDPPSASFMEALSTWSANPENVDFHIPDPTDDFELPPTTTCIL